MVKARSDWLLQLQTSFAIHLRATRTRKYCNRWTYNHLFVLYHLSILVSYPRTTMHLSVGSWPQRAAPQQGGLATTSHLHFVNSC